MGFSTGIRFLMLLGSAAIAACIPVKNIFIRGDGSARVEQLIYQSSGYEKYRNRDFYAYYNRYGEAPEDTSMKGWYFADFLENYSGEACVGKGPTDISRPSYVYPEYFIELNRVDSIPHYLAGYPEDYIRIERESPDSYVIKTCTLPGEKINSESVFYNRPGVLYVTFDRPVAANITDSLYMDRRKFRKTNKKWPNSVAVTTPPLKKASNDKKQVWHLILLEDEKSVVP